MSQNGPQPARDRQRSDPTIGTALGLLAVLMLILATAFFVAAEFAVVATDRTRLEAMAADGSRGARAALTVHRRLSFHLSGAQLGLTVVSLVLGFVAEPTLARVFEPAFGFLSESTARGVSVALALALATVLSMVVGELIPKNLVLARPEASAERLATPLHLFSLALTPVILLSNGAANRLVRLLGVEPQEELAPVRTIDDMAVLIRASGEGGTLPEERAHLLARSIRFGEKTAADALVPRVSVTSIDGEQTLADLVDLAIETGHSRFPVVRGDLDAVIGVVHVKDIYKVAAQDRVRTSVTTIMSEPLAVPETRLLEDLFAELRSGGRHLAIVIDEYGGTAGVITVEDLLEEIVGEIDDEHDAPTEAARFEQRSGSWILAGTLHHDEVLDACGFEVPEGEYDTLAGFMLARLGHIPGVRETVDADEWDLVVEAMDRLRIAWVRLTPRTIPDDHEGGRS